ncbi:DUF7670 domain-containing protein [Paludibaculum fermentans]|uniref:DUF7670 domain-containing protein n=1 Tax=Paludibaculum fermentans TaxID=1473598 RepID=A0A7S7NVA0_PALFE|nr:hypothetical protein [Paludibaculum fermentans]QOY90409.1 hypothetical protein IRI77_10765 [Paludibaculum fermentans]
MQHIHFPLWNVQHREAGLARAISACWAAFWTWFGFACGVAEFASFTDVLQQTVPGILFIGATALAWRFPREGGALLLALGIVVFGVYWNFATQQSGGAAMLTAVMLVGPPMLAGTLFLRAPEDHRTATMAPRH